MDVEVCGFCFDLLIALRYISIFDWVVLRLRRLFHHLNLASLLTVIFYLNATEEGLLDNLFPLISLFEQFGAHSMLSAAHELDPAHDFHLVTYLLIAEVRKFVNPRVAALATTTAWNEI